MVKLYSELVMNFDIVKKVVIFQPQMLSRACMGNINLNTQWIIQIKNEKKKNLLSFREDLVGQPHQMDQGDPGKEYN